jgi:D-glycero-alpha-D-manno-heptose-7-phosphate kinase
MIISRTPVRITFLGGGTDYPNYFLKHGGQTLGMGINKYSYISVNKLEDNSKFLYKLSYSKNENVKKIEEIKHPSVKACLKFLDIENVEIKYSGDLPAKSGLGSSSSFTVGLLNALYKFKGTQISQKELANNAIFVEQKIIGEQVGCQDQYTCSLGGLQSIKYYSDGKIETKPIELSNEKINDLNSYLMLFYTGIQRYSEDILGEQVKLTKEGKIDEYLSETKKLANKLDKNLNNKNLKNFNFVGELINEGWLLKKKFSNQITNKKIDLMYEKAKKAGAIGGKLLGAGGGGYMLLFVDPINQPSVDNALIEFKKINFKMDSLGSQIIYTSKNY